MTPMAEVLATTLTTADRCDRCGARAYVQVERHLSVLYFCAHHGHEHLAALVAKGWLLVVDDRVT